MAVFGGMCYDPDEAENNFGDCSSASIEMGVEVWIFEVGA
jgi:hypothetical protein